MTCSAKTSMSFMSLECLFFGNSSKHFAIAFLNMSGSHISISGVYAVWFFCLIVGWRAGHHKVKHSCKLNLGLWISKDGFSMTLELKVNICVFIWWMSSSEHGSRTANMSQRFILWRDPCLINAPLLFKILLPALQSSLCQRVPGPATLHWLILIREYRWPSCCLKIQFLLCRRLNTKKTVLVVPFLYWICFSLKQQNCWCTETLLP